MEEVKKDSLCVGILAHVDAGKTTLSEAMLYVGGARRTLGRVDHGDAWLDTHALERKRGITIFSKQALLETDHRRITLVDTPGHADFGAEAERVLPVLDCAILVISGNAGIQAHTLTIWELLRRYHVPTFIFVSKMDLPGADREQLLQALQNQFGACVDFNDGLSQIEENVALCDEGVLEQYLSGGGVTAQTVSSLIAAEKVFPCCFGAGLKLEGVPRLLEVLDTYGVRREYPEEFGARVYKISRDDQGSRLTWLKVTGGSLRVRSTLSYRDRKGVPQEEKLQQLRRYSGDKFTAVQEVFAGELCAVTGITATWAGQGLGREQDSAVPVLEPVMTYRICLPGDCDPLTVLPKLRLLEEEDPQLHILWDDKLKQIQVQIMGRIQLEVLRSLILERFSLDVTLDSGRIYYKETIENTVEGVGHFEPLRHYAEVHLLLEPLPQGSGLVFESRCSTDALDINYQNLVLTHLAEKSHPGVLTGAPITDMRISLLVGKAHLKHTEGGDFRQATYRAVRQGLMQAKCRLLEPWYRFVLTVPMQQVGRAITDLRAMSAEFQNPEGTGERVQITGLVPAAELGDYADRVAAYTQGLGQLQLALQGYAPCHNAQQVMEEAAYDPEADTDNPPGSVFCAHGAGFYVPWDQVGEYMHLDSGFQKAEEPTIIARNLQAEDKALEAILHRYFGDDTPRHYRPAEKRPVQEQVVIRPPREQCLIVDGYNMIFAWEALAKTAESDLDAARRQLVDLLSGYAGFTGIRIILVFDGYKVKGSAGSQTRFGDLQIVYTGENETADAYMESLAAQIGKSYSVKVATSDALVQLGSLRSGVLRMSDRELWDILQQTKEKMRAHFDA